jgi:PKD repeat protein
MKIIKITLFIILHIACVNSYAQYLMNDTAGSYTTCNGTFYDSGGSGGNYGFNEGSVLTFYPSTPNSKLTFNFYSYATELLGDFLRAYDGPDIFSPQVGSYNDSNGPLNGNLTATNPQGAITFYFTSDAFANWAGWSAVIDCIPDGTLTYNMNYLATPQIDTVCDGIFFDAGGLSQMYANNLSGIHTFYPSTPNSAVQLDFSYFNTENNYDGLMIYNGPDTTYPLLSSIYPAGLNPITCPAGCYRGAAGPNLVKSTDISGALTFVFRSNSGTVKPGWLANISCVPNTGTFVFMDDAINTHTLCAAGFYDSGSDNANYSNYENYTQTFIPGTPGEFVKLDFGNVNLGAGDTLYIYDGLNTAGPLKATFTGTISSINVISSHPTGGLTAKFKSDGANTSLGWHAGVSCVSIAPPYITMPNSTYTDSTCFGNFYDSGGPTQPYGSYLYQTLTIYPSTPNYALQVAFQSFSTEPWGDGLRIFNGPNINSPLFSSGQPVGNSALYCPAGAYSGTQNPGVLTSSDPSGALTFQFGANQTSSYAGWHATLNCVAQNTYTTALFTSNVTQITSGGSVNFTDQSTNNPTSWQWSFPGGTPSTSTLQNPTNIVYNTPGCYEVTLVASNAAGSNTHAVPCYIYVTAPALPPVAAFTANTFNINAGNSVNFTDLSTNSPTSRLWTFVGGTPASSTSTNPNNITYNTAGCYEVTLVATNAFGSDTETQTCYITVNAPNIPPVAAFNANNNFILPNGAVNFTDQSANNPTAWQWTFTGGNPSTSTQQNPSNIVYTTPGCYAVTLVATNAYGNDSQVSTCFITVSNPSNACSEIFISEYLEGNSNDKAIEFYNPTNATINMSGYSLQLYNNGSSTANFTYNFSGNLGAHQVFVLANLTASANILALADATSAVCGFNGNDALLFKYNGTIIDVIGTAGIDPGVSWPAGSGSTANNTLVRNANVDAPTNSWLVSQSQWTSYPIGTISYLGYNTNNCASAVQVPVANFTVSSLNISTGQSVNFTDLSTNNPTSWSWSFQGAAPAFSTSQNPSNITYNTPGCFQVVLTATNSAGSNTSTQVCYINVTNPVITPVANFISNTQYITVGQTVNFTDLSTNNPTAWNWTFTDASPASSTSQNPTNITYNSAGCFQVVLTATNSAGSNTSTQICYINVVPLGIQPLADFSINPNPACTNANVNLINASTNALSFIWEMIGAIPSTSTAQFPVISYANAGTYQIKLIAINSANSDTLIQSITINPSPTVNAGADVGICFGTSVTLNTTSIGNLSYNWTPAATLSTPTQSQTLATPTADTDYVITVNDGVCSASDTITVIVWPLPVTTIITQVGNNLEATNGFPAYQWYVNSTVIIGETQAVITPTSNGNYSVDAIDTNGCISTSQVFSFVIQAVNYTANNQINIYPNPAVIELIIDWPQQTKNWQIEMIDAQGKTISTEETRGQKTTLYLSSLPSGIYVLKLNSEDQFLTYKFIKQ